MMRCVGRWLPVVVGAVVFLSAHTASAQVIGTFGWQLAPFCNVVTLTVVQQGASFVLNGFDDQCGAAQRAAAGGTAHLNPDGTAGLAFTVIRPDGLTIPTSATVNLATITGAWSDEYANAGSFLFNPPSPTTGAPRRITLTGTLRVETYAPVMGAHSGTAFSFGRTLAVAPASQIVTAGPTANCPGSFHDPQALPGQLCLYRVSFNNISKSVVFGLLGASSDRSGASLQVVSTMAGPTLWEGRWAVTIP